MYTYAYIRIHIKMIVLFIHLGYILIKTVYFEPVIGFPPM